MLTIQPTPNLSVHMPEGDFDPARVLAIPELSTATQYSHSIHNDALPVELSAEIKHGF